MSLQQDFQNLDSAVQLLVIGGIVFVAWNIYRSISNSADGNPFAAFLPDPNDTTGDPNSVGDTSQAAYAGNGLLGALGNAFNQALGGIPQSVGGAIANNLPVSSQ